MKNLLPLLALLVGCPDPAATTDPATQAGNQGPGGPGGPAGGPEGGGPAGGPEGGAGVTTAPPTGEGGVVPGAFGERPTPTGFAVAAGEGIKISGVVTYGGSEKGTLRIDFLRNPEGSPFPELLHSLTLSGPGNWSVDAPKDLGEISVVAFIDKDENGPTPGEPMAINKDPIKVGSADIKDIALELSLTPDMGMFAPKGAPGTAPTGAMGGPLGASGTAPGGEGAVPGTEPPAGGPAGAVPGADAAAGGAPGAPPAGGAAVPPAAGGAPAATPAPN